MVLGGEEEVAESQRDRPFLRGLLGWSSDTCPAFNNVHVQPMSEG